MTSTATRGGKVRAGPKGKMRPRPREKDRNSDEARAVGPPLAQQPAMTDIALASVPSRRRIRAFAFTSVLVVALTWAPTSATAQTFSGLYGGLDAGRQHIIAGALVDDIDTLADDVRLVTSVFGGLRRQFGGVVVGAELGVGRMDGDLRLEEPARGLVVDYAGDSQWHWALSAGHTLGPRTLVFGYVSEVSRSFDVSVAGPAATFTQRDEQGLLRFGAGLEQVLRGPLRIRVTAGSSRADFGDRTTNVEITRRFEVSAGLVWQF